MGKGGEKSAEAIVVRSLGGRRAESLEPRSSHRRLDEREAAEKKKVGIVSNENTHASAVPSDGGTEPGAHEGSKRLRRLKEDEP